MMKEKCNFSSNLNRMIVAAVLALTGTMQIWAQTASEAEYALKVLKGAESAQTKRWAVDVLQRSVSIDSSSVVMNGLGLAYMAGIGVEADSVQARKWLEQAGIHGYSEAYHNLGMMYKYSHCGVKQDFERAFYYFSLGASAGSTTCLYDKGYMLYKGLGCRQNYAEAVNCFVVADSLFSPPSAYMLGLCYRNGFGVEKDAAHAMQYLQKSAHLGYRDATDELLRDKEETFLHELYEDSNLGGMPQSLSSVNDISLLDGNFQGCLITYDWSGKYVIDEKPMAMSIERIGENVQGTMVVGYDTIPFRAELTSDSQLDFKKGRLSISERYANGMKVKYRVNRMLFDVWSNKILGRLSLYSLKQREPERPMYFELDRNGQSATCDDATGAVRILQNPFDQQFTVIFSLVENADVEVYLFNIQGLLAWKKNLGLFAKGSQIIQLSPVIQPGRYVLNIKAGRKMFHAIVIKEGGER